MPKFHVQAQVTISLHTVVEADSAEQARKVADEQAMGTIGDPESFGESEDDYWLHSGEIDGEPFDIVVTREDGET